jgi:dihydrofolate reductase
MVAIIVACDEKRGIGKDYSIPWHFTEDLQIFKARTTGSAVIMGRVTWDSIPKKPLRHRLNVVITTEVEKQRNMHPQHPLWGPIFVDSLESALKICEEKDIFIIGGETIYKKAIESGIVNEIIITKIPGDYGCDRFFPEIGKEWKKDKSSVHIGFEIVNYLKVFDK